jgi:hypothetical protein
MLQALIGDEALLMLVLMPPGSKSTLLWSPDVGQQLHYLLGSSDALHMCSVQPPQQTAINQP